MWSVLNNNRVVEGRVERVSDLYVYLDLTPRVNVPFPFSVGFRIYVIEDVTPLKSQPSKP